MPGEIEFRVEANSVVASASSNEGTLWIHSFPAATELRIEPLNTSPPSCIVLVVGSSPGFVSQLLRLNPDTSIAWTLDAHPDYGDWIQIELAGNNLIAHTWGCDGISIDAQSGKILSGVFTK